MELHYHPAYRQGILLLLLNILLISCIKQSSEECPAIYHSILIIKDKNFSNITEIPGLSSQDEQLAFKQYISVFSYRLMQIPGNKTVDSLTDFVVKNDEKTQTLYFPSIQPGQYILELYGNTTQVPVMENDYATYTLHSSGGEGEDIYLCCDTILFTPEHPENTIQLVRAKGALFVEIENIPDSVTRINETITQVYNNVNAVGAYSNMTTVSKDFTDNLHPTPSLLTFLAPTVNGQQSTLRIALYAKGNSTPFMFIPDIFLTIKRNEISAFKFSFQPEGGIEVWILVNGSWKKSHDLDITN